MKKDKDNSGFIALTSVIIISSFFVVIFAGMFFSAISQIEKADDRGFATKALSLANSCAEEALNNLKNSLAYEGDETISIGDYTCSILEIDATDDSRVIKVEGEVGGYVKRVQLDVDVFDHPYLVIMDWRIVPFFSNL